MLQTKKPQETLNKENKDVISEKSTNYFCKILLNNINIKENGKQKCFQKSENKEIYNSELKTCEQMDVKVLGDHSYFERLDDKMPNRKGISPPVTSNNVFDDATNEEKIVLMVVGTDSVHMKEYSHVNEELAEKTNCPDSDTVYLPDDTQIKSTESSTTTKPKGKAKFIGTSKEEREMALAYMERIKKKGNPTGSNLQCRICDPPRSFTAPTTLVSHYRSHAGIKPYECRICRAVFTRRHSLKYHMLIHQNQTRFTCGDCGKKFRHPSHFREHQRRHTGEAPFGCDDCGQRFKTRNTYKRHLKTRHGKILTTIGEVLNLSEEDFQKVRTSRRRKDVCAPQTTVNAVSNAVVDYGKQNDEAQASSTMEECVMREDVNDINENWETKGTTRVLDKCFEDFEICSEPRLNKTDGTETEIIVDCRYPSRNGSNVSVECINSVQNDLLQVKNSLYDDLRVISSEEKHVYQHNISDQNKIDDCSDETEYEYSEVNCNDGTLKTKEHENMARCEANLDFPKEQDGSHSRVLHESTHDYHKIVYDGDKREESATYMHLKPELTEAASSSGDNQTRDDAHVSMTQDDSASERSKNCATSFDSENEDRARNNIIFCTQIANANVNILQTADEAGGKVQQEQDNALQKNVSESDVTQSVESMNVSSENLVEANHKIDRQQTNRYLYVRPEPTNKIIAQNKCISIPLHQVKLYRNQQSQLKADCGKIRILNGNVRAINIKQSDKQNAILLISGDNLKNGIFQIDKSSAVVKNLKR
ncbi:uncharacterized protein LOC105287796 isoform X2 [Ooceraea biroi]|nr:uncharacterized protein LOC105287796 isoform X2 [Ooceraea biroi]